MEHFNPNAGASSPLLPRTVARYRRVPISSVPIHDWRQTMAWLESNPGSLLVSPDGMSSLYVDERAVTAMGQRGEAAMRIVLSR